MKEKNDSTVFSEEDFEKLFRLKGKEKEQFFSKPEKKWWKEPQKPLIIRKIRQPTDKRPLLPFWSDLEKPRAQFKLTNLASTISFGPLKWLILALVLVLILLWPTLFLRLSYWYQTDFKNLPFKTFSREEVTRQRETNNALGKATIYLPKIGVLAPLVFNLPTEYSKEMKRLGLIHLKGTSKPPDAGQAIILGGSFRHIFTPKGFSDCLALLDQLVVGDELYFFTDGREIKYKVTQISTQLSSKPISFYDELNRTIKSSKDQNQSELILISQFPFAPWRRLYVAFNPVY